MKKSILVLASLAFLGVQAQDGYNKWSVDVNGGLNKAVSPLMLQPLQVRGVHQ